MLENGVIDIASEEEASRCRIAEMLWEVQGVSGVMLGEDFISINKNVDADWEILKPQIFSVIVEYFTTDSTAVQVDEAEEDIECTDAASKRIKEIIDTKVRPAVMEDGGNIVFRGYKDGIVYLKLQGACAGCPSSAVTLKDGIENMLQYYVPEVKEVQQV